MNSPARWLIIVASAAACAAGWACVDQNGFGGGAADMNPLVTDDRSGGYEFASSDLYGGRFAELEEIIRADAAHRFPNKRLELGSIRSDHGSLSVTVALFGPNRQSEAFLYSLEPENRSWKVKGAKKLWFVAPSQIARGLRV
ncbi:MAG: hypothetical protein ACJ8M1_04270 [Chthoniobacterales bacterium]